MKAWVAKDKNGQIYLYLSEPRREVSHWLSKPGSYIRIQDTELLGDMSPDWTDKDPIEVELKLEKKCDKERFITASQEIRLKLIFILPTVTHVGIAEINPEVPIWHQHGIDELDILDFLMAIDEEFGTDLFSNNKDIDLLRVTIDDIVTLVKYKVGK